MDKKKLNTIYIISKGRPHCKTAQMLQKLDYTGDWFIVCGTNDETLSQYQEKWGKDKILIFDWKKELETTDVLDNFGFEDMSSGAVPVRNATRKISENRRELRHWQLDDDYDNSYQYDPINKKYIHITGKELEDKMYKIALFGYKTNLPNVGISLSVETFPDQAYTIARRVFNLHNMPSTEDLFIKWRGRMNDDLINALEVYHKGKPEMSFKFVSVHPEPTQSSEGGLTDIYKQTGTVRKTAYAVLIEPNNVKLRIKFGRYHHHVNWNYICPKIISDKYTKLSVV